MMKVILHFGLAVLVAGCAQQPERIAAIDVAGMPYRGFSCKQLDAEHLKVTQDLAATSAAQKRAANGDAWGVFLLGLPLSSMSGNDKEAVVAVAKGRINELDRMLLDGNC
ncbi:hypothetical protein ROLI_034250 [Roseobacter fucihabitans]|uniref:Lipoprotein n=2 Tax=Roseobacter fucihabitans TaxID=1537242 RepID=A0ABZ2BWG0_9RHOB|nr:hypothetical protein [Roseobacter litoralis]